MGLEILLCIRNRWFVSSRWADIKSALPSQFSADAMSLTELVAVNINQRRVRLFIDPAQGLHETHTKADYVCGSEVAALRRPSPESADLQGQFFHYFRRKP